MWGKTKRKTLFLHFQKNGLLFLEGGAIAANGPAQLRHWKTYNEKDGMADSILI